MRGRGWAALAAAPVLVGAAAGSIAALAQPPEYVATVSVLVSGGVQASTDRGESPDPSSAPSLTATYAALATADAVLAPAAQRLHMSEAALACSIAATAAGSVVRITARTATAESAAPTANAVAASLVGAAGTVHPPTSAAMRSVLLAVVQRATPPSSPDRSALWRDLGLGGGAGAGVVLVVLAVRSVRRIPAPTAGAAPSLPLG